MSSMEQLYEKAQLVSELVDDLRERMERTVFKGESWDGSVKISSRGTGEPVDVSITAPIPDDVRCTLEQGIREALDRWCDARAAFMNDGLASIQEATGVGPGFQPPL